ncbi:hypothetical protein BDQ17DRAFT_1249886 [Cyathus striatus]|nr:hypothetical protein BDQ17DRAFT_1249886 [Cyathus striatus]
MYFKTAYKSFKIDIGGCFWIWRIASASKKYPPGPIKLPILGNALIIPTNNPWFKFTEWKARYGTCI